MDQPNICHLLGGVFKNLINIMGELSFFGLVPSSVLVFSKSVTPIIRRQGGIQRPRGPVFLISRPPASFYGSRSCPLGNSLFSSTNEWKGLVTSANTKVGAFSRGP